MGAKVCLVPPTIIVPPVGVVTDCCVDVKLTFVNGAVCLLPLTTVVPLVDVVTGCCVDVGLTVVAGAACDAVTG